MPVYRSSDELRCPSTSSSSSSSSSRSASIARVAATEMHPHWGNIAVLSQRLFEAHFLPLHLLICTAAGGLYSLLMPAPDVERELLFLFQCTAYLRILGLLGLMHYLLYYERYHKVCVARRESEMKRVGLAEQMDGSFVHRKPLWNAFDYCLLPVAGALYGPIPALHAQVAHFWTVDLKYVVSLKPIKSTAQAHGSEKLV